MSLPNRKPSITGEALADILDVSASTIRGWIRQGLPVFKRKPNRFKEEDVRKWLEAREHEKSGMAEALRRRAQAQAVLAEQNAAMRAGALLPRDQVEKGWLAELMEVRARLLAWPTVRGDSLYRVARDEGPDAFKRALKKLVYELLEEFSKREWAKKKRTRARGSGRRKK